MFETIGRSFRLLKLCLHVLAVDKELIFFPIFSSIGVVLVFLSFMGIGFGIGAFDRLEEGTPGALDYVVLFAFYVFSYFIIIFFNSALVFAAHERLAGGDPNIRSGLNGAFHRVITIFKWAVIAATVGLILRILAGQARERGGILGIIGYIVVQLLGAAWTMVTFFVVPLIVIEHRSLGDAFKGSLSMLRRTWGEQVTANFGLGIAGLIVGPDCLCHQRGAVLRAIAHRHIRRDSGHCHRGRSAGRRGPGVRHAGRHLQGGPVQLRDRWAGALALPGRRSARRVSPELEPMPASMAQARGGIEALYPFRPQAERARPRSMR